MYRLLPNQLTVLRLILAGVFFLVLNQYRHDADVWVGWIPLAIVLFIIAALTDVLDGYLARRWQVVSAFGRVMDPFCDKVLILGAFIYLAGPRFVDPAAAADGQLLTMSSGIYPWMVVLILARELLVTGIRGELEGKGVEFGANWAGKAKMLLQSITIPVVLLIVWLDPTDPDRAWLAWPRDIFVYATVLATLVSAAPYITNARHMMRNDGSQ